MSLEAVHKLARYEIVEPIDKGGMSEVFRAHDTKLDHDGALKVLRSMTRRTLDRNPVVPRGGP